MPILSIGELGTLAFDASGSQSQRYDRAKIQHENISTNGSNHSEIQKKQKQNVQCEF